MSEQIREQISAFLDGELPDSETELLLKRLARDAQLRETFGRYAFIAEAVRSPEGVPLSRNFLQGINGRIDAEPAAAPIAATVARARRWWRPLAGAAVAAGVATVAVVMLEQRTELPLTAARTAPAAVAAPTLPAASAALTPSPTLGGTPPFKPHEDLSYTVPALAPDNATALPAARLTNYVFAHSKYSSALGQRNVLSGLVADQPPADIPAADALPAQPDAPLAAPSP